MRGLRPAARRVGRIESADVLTGRGTRPPADRPRRGPARAAGAFGCGADPQDAARRGIRHDLCRMAIGSVIPPGAEAGLHRRLLDAYEASSAVDPAVLTRASNGHGVSWRSGCAGWGNPSTRTAWPSRTDWFSMARMSLRPKSSTVFRCPTTPRSRCSTAQIPHCPARARHPRPTRRRRRRGEGAP